MPTCVVTEVTLLFWSVWNRPNQHIKGYYVPLMLFLSDLKLQRVWLRSLSGSRLIILLPKHTTKTCRTIAGIWHLPTKDGYGKDKYGVKR